MSRVSDQTHILHDTKIIDDSRLEGVGINDKIRYLNKYKIFFIIYRLSKKFYLM